MRAVAAALGAAALVALAGAEGGGCKADREVPVEVVRSAVQCGVEGGEFTVRRIGSAAQLGLAVAPESRLGGAGPGAGASALDFEREAVLLLAMGRRPTGGYAVELARPAALVKGNVAAIQVRLREPPPGAITIQVLTSPCLVVKLPKEGIAEVKVAGEDGEVLSAVRL